MLFLVKKFLTSLFLVLVLNKLYCGELKIAVLKYGSVNWELDVLHYHNLHIVLIILHKNPM